MDAVKVYYVVEKCSKILNWKMFAGVLNYSHLLKRQCLLYIIDLRVNFPAALLLEGFPLYQFQLWDGMDNVFSLSL